MIKDRINKLTEYFKDKQHDSNAQITNAAVETQIEHNEEIVGFYMQYRLDINYNHWCDTEPQNYQICLPLEENLKVFNSIEQLTEHIKIHHPTAERDKYFFDRNDEEVRDAVIEAFREAECRETEKQRKEAEKKLERTKKKLERLDCERQ